MKIELVAYISKNGCDAIVTFCYSSFLCSYIWDLRLPPHSPPQTMQEVTYLPTTDRLPHPPDRLHRHSDSFDIFCSPCFNVL